MSVDKAVPRSRRALLGAAAAAAAATAAASLGRPLQATAANGDPLILGQQNSAVDHTWLHGFLRVSAKAYDDVTIRGIDESTTGNSVAVDGVSATGIGIRGLAQGFQPAVEGKASHPQGVGVAATNVELGTALMVRGKAKFLHRSGRATVRAGKSLTDIDLRLKGGLSGTPLCFANLTTYRRGVYVTAVRPNHPIAGKARIYLNRAVSGNTFVAWFVLD
jgi:hypothetical protein